MPVFVKRTRSDDTVVWRVVEDDGRIARNAAGTAVDGGGHPTKREAQAQASAINISEARKKEQRFRNNDL